MAASRQVWSGDGVWLKSNAHKKFDLSYSQRPIGRISAMDPEHHALG
jgi:hypothetical protein